MTNLQFLALAKLMGMRSPSTMAAARAVLVDGMRPSEAARLTGLSPASVCNAVSRCKRAWKLAHKSVSEHRVMFNE